MQEEWILQNVWKITQMSLNMSLRPIEWKAKSVIQRSLTILPHLRVELPKTPCQRAPPQQNIAILKISATLNSLDCALILANQPGQS